MLITVSIPKEAADNADGTEVIAAANVLSTWKDSAKHVHVIAPVSVSLDQKNVEAELSEDYTQVLIRKLNGKSGSVKVPLTYPGGVTKKVTVKVKKGK
ncbi:MAG: hypothetical protein K5697_00875 [Lachnospiraceae bacterium]|nr:hypothetical protein [Lachnospiraceae bacterium]